MWRPGIRIREITSRRLCTVLGWSAGLPFRRHQVIPTPGRPVCSSARVRIDRDGPRGSVRTPARRLFGRVGRNDGTFVGSADGSARRSPRTPARRDLSRRPAHDSVSRIGQALFRDRDPRSYGSCRAGTMIVAAAKRRIEAAWSFSRLLLASRRRAVTGADVGVSSGEGGVLMRPRCASRRGQPIITR